MTERQALRRIKVRTRKLRELLEKLSDAADLGEERDLYYLARAIRRLEEELWEGVTNATNGQFNPNDVPELPSWLKRGRLPKRWTPERCDALLDYQLERFHAGENGDRIRAAIRKYGREAFEKLDREEIKELGELM